MRFIALLLLALAAFSNPVSADENKPIKVFVAYSHNANVGKVDDNGFLNSARTGLREVEKKFGVETKEFIQGKDEEPEALYARIAAEKPDMIIGLGVFHVRPVLSIAENFPDIKFTVVGGIVPPLFPNGQSIIFKDHEGAFLAGAAAAMATKTGTIGFIGGRDTPPTRSFQRGFEQGAKYVNSNAKTLADMIGTDVDAWSNPEGARKLAIKQIEDGADVIFTAAGASGREVLKVAKEKSALGIGVDVNQDGLYPGSVLTSIIKRTDLAIIDTVKDLVEENWKPSVKYVGVANGYMDYSYDQHNRKILTEQMRIRLSKIKEQILDGSIEIEP